MKGVLFLALVTSFLLTLAGCSQNPTEQNDESQNQPLYLWVKGTVKLSDGTLFQSDTLRKFVVPEKLRKDFKHFLEMLPKTSVQCSRTETLYQWNPLAISLEPGSTVGLSGFNYSMCSSTDWEFWPISTIFCTGCSFSQRIRIIDLAANVDISSDETEYPFGGHNDVFTGDAVEAAHLSFARDNDLDGVTVYITNGEDSNSDLELIKVQFHIEAGR